MRVDLGRLEAQRPHAALHFDDLPDVALVLQLRLGPRGGEDTIVEARRRLLDFAQGRREPAGFVERGLLALALGAAGEVRLQLDRAHRRELSVGEVEQQILGFGVRHALPNRTPCAGSSAEVFASTPAARSALRSPSSA